MDIGEKIARDGRRVAIVHEWVAARAGSEQVFERLAQQFPSADLFALSVTPSVQLNLAGRDVKTTFLDRRIFRDRRGVTLPLMPMAWKSLKTDAPYDLVITSHHSFATSNALCAQDGKHLAYVHSPARYVWTPEIDERGASPLLRPARAVLQKLDRSASAGVTSIAANSSAVRDRIMKFWERESTVIFPPVRTEMFGDGRRGAQPREFALAFGRWIPYKRFDLAIEASVRAKLPLVVAGSGPEEGRLRQLAETLGADVTFVVRPDDHIVRDLYRRAVALLFPANEDFGIIPVEAQAAGTPVIAPAEGGARDTVVDGETGLLLKSLTADTVAEALVEASRRRWDDFTHLEQFSTSAFDRRVADWVTAFI